LRVSRSCATRPLPFFSSFFFFFPPFFWQRSGRQDFRGQEGAKTAVRKISPALPPASPLFFFPQRNSRVKKRPRSARAPTLAPKSTARPGSVSPPFFPLFLFLFFYIPLWWLREMGTLVEYSADAGEEQAATDQERGDLDPSPSFSFPFFFFFFLLFSFFSDEGSCGNLAS